MRILQVNCVYKVGSTGKIVDCVGEVLRGMGHDVLTCYGIGNNHYDDFSIKICSGIEHKINALIMRIRGIPYGGVYCSNRRFYRLLSDYQPDVVHIHCINASMINVYQLFKYLGKKKIKTVVTLHSEIYHTAGCEHAFECEKFKNQCNNCSSYCYRSWFFDRSRQAWQKMYDSFSGFHHDYIMITAVSPWLTNRAKQSSILRRLNVEYVPNGLNTSLFYPHEKTGLIDRTGYQGIILYVTAIFTQKEADQKGGRYISDLAHLLPEYKFVVVASQSSLSDKLPKNVHLWGRAHSQVELAQLYSEADVTLILSKREAFSMVTAESLCCGTPVVGFMAGGPESIAIPESSAFVEYGDIVALANALNQQFRVSVDRDSLSKKAAMLYSQERMATQYLDAYTNLLSNKC